MTTICVFSVDFSTDSHRSLSLSLTRRDCYKANISLLFILGITRLDCLYYRDDQTVCMWEWENMCLWGGCCSLTDKIRIINARSKLRAFGHGLALAGAKEGEPLIKSRLAISVNSCTGLNRFDEIWSNVCISRENVELLYRVWKCGSGNISI